jgi:DNA-binding transcriptional LysR family regulator
VSGDKGLSVVCARPSKQHTLAVVVRDDDGVLWLHVPRAYAGPDDGWKGTPRRVRLRVNDLSSIRVACACGLDGLLPHRLVIEALVRGNKRLVWPERDTPRPPGN